MSNETGVQGGPHTVLHSLIPLADFKAILGVDDREDCLDFASVRNLGCEFLPGKNSTTLFQPPSMAAFCLITAAYTIEQYCKRRLVRRRNTDYLTFSGEYIFSLREYPVHKILTIHAIGAGAVIQGEALFGPENLVDPKHYYCLPEPSTDAEGGANPPAALCFFTKICYIIARATFHKPAVGGGGGEKRT